MLQTYWYNSSFNLPQYELSFYSISANSSRKTQPYSRIDVMSNQPSTNTKDNCTAAVTDLSVAFFTWVIIPCNKSFEGTFFCVKPIETKPVNFKLAVNPINRTCEDGWILLPGSFQCFLLLKTPYVLVSFVEIENMCSLTGGSVLSTRTAPRPPVDTDEGKHILSGLSRMASSTLYHREMTQKWGQDTTKLFDFFFGQPLLHVEFKSSLARLLYIAENGFSLPLKFISNVNGKCGVLVVSANSMYRQRYLRGKYEKGWGGKYRACGAKIDSISAVICEKPTKAYTPYCGSHHFVCGDSSCILNLYFCDQVSDCFDGSDETACDRGSGEALMTSTHNILMHCVLTETCKPPKTDMLVPIHAICDGVNIFNLTFPQTICMRNLKLNVNIFAMQNSRNFGGQHDTNLFRKTVALWYKRELHHLNLMKHKKTPNQNINKFKYTSLVKYMVPCRWTGEKIALDKRCKVSVHNTPCDFGSIALLCQYIVCPGMFKCTNFYCIYMSAVCDGQSDCYHGEDEQFCTHISCPGLLKCRGENRCVSENEICDNHPDCILSSDDEIICQICAEGCVCNGYMSYCNNKEDIHSYSQINKMTYIKGLVIQSSEAKLYLNSLNLVSLIYLNISFNNNDIGLNTNHHSNLNLLFGEFSHNKINSTRFLQHVMFSTIVLLNLENNLLTNFNVKDSQMHYLKVLNLNHNPLISLIINIEHMARLIVLELRYIEFRHDISLTFYSETGNDIEVYVTDSTICCMLSQNITCISAKVREHCYGLIEDYILKYSFYSLVSLTVIFVSVAFFTNVSALRDIKTASSTRFIVKTNIMIADGICSIYLLCIAISDVIGVDEIQFRIGLLCIILNAISFISFEGCLVFKTFHSMCVMLKTLFPFKHQCRWLRFSGIICGIVWVVLIAIYIASLVYRYTINSMILDNLCSFAECQTNRTHDILPILGSLINTLGLIVICICSTVFFISLQHYNKVLQVRRPTLMIMYRLCRPLCTEVLLRSYILSIFGVKLFGWFKNNNTCFIIVIILLPINIIIYNIFTLF